MTKKTPLNKTVVPFGLTATAAEKKIREIAKITQNTIFGNHASQRMVERGITDVQVFEILRNGFVMEPPEETEIGEWKCKITKELRGRREAGVVVIILHQGKLFIKTVEWEDLR